MIGLYHRIDGDLFGIVRRLKGMDRGYFVLYSYKNKRYEIHNRGNRGSTYCFSCPRLDERTITQANKTRCERIDALLAETEAHNQRVLKIAAEKAVKKIERGVEAVLGGRSNES